LKEKLDHWLEMMDIIKNTEPENNNLTNEQSLPS